MKESDYVKINSLNPLHLIIGEVDGYIEEINRNKYLIFGSTDKNKEVLKKYTELRDEIKYQIKTRNGGKPGDYDEKYRKIKFNSDDNLRLNKILRLYNLTIIVGSVFGEDGKYYPQVFLDECLYEL